MRSLSFGLLLAVAAAQAQENKPVVPVGDLTVGYTYLFADQGMNYRSNLNGWFVRPSVTLGKGYSFFADFTNYYGVNAKGSTNSHGVTLGLAKSVYSRPRVKVSVFAESGYARSSGAGSITYALSANAGASFALPLRPWVSLLLTPAEYIYTNPSGDWRNNFNSKVGLTFPFGRR